MPDGLRRIMSAGVLLAVVGGVQVWGDEWEYSLHDGYPAAAAGSVYEPYVSLTAQVEDMTTPGPVLPVPVHPEFRFDTVNGISLSDDTAAVVQKRGEPLASYRDSQMTDKVIYEYGDMKVAFRDSLVLYVAVPAEAETVTVDGYPISAAKDAFRKAFGNPDFTAEDGEVYIREGGALKLFIDPDTGVLRSIHYFPAAGL